MVVVNFFFFFFTEYVQTGPYNKTYTESQLQAGGGFILPDFNEEQVGGLNESHQRVGTTETSSDLLKKCIRVA